MHRRDFLKIPTALAVSGLGVSFVPLKAFAQDGDAPVQFTALQRYSLGDWTVTALSDGYFEIAADAMVGIDATDFDALLMGAFAGSGSARAAVNAYVVDTGETLILIDSGTGSVFGPTLGQLAANMAAANLDPARVSLLLTTHLHPDHIGGATASGAPLFPNAGFYASVGDHAFFTNDDVQAAAPDAFKPFFDLAKATVDSYGEKLMLFDGDADIVSGIRAMALPGHTPGHVGYMLESAGETMLIWGDVVHVPEVQFARPDATLIFDIDGETAAATRLALFDQVATDRQLVAGMHMPFPGFGYVARDGAAYRFVPAAWEYF